MDTAAIRSNDITPNEEGLKAATTQKELLEKAWAAFVKPTDEQLLQLLLFKNNLTKEHLTYTAPPIYPQGHLLSFGLKITARDSSSLASKWHIMPLENDSLGFTVAVRKKPFVSFSSGIFTGFGKNFRTPTYEWQPQANGSGTVTDSAQYKLVNTGNASPPIGAAALANISYKLTKSFGAAASFGVGITIEDKPKPVYLAGASLLLGSRNQLAITFGVAGMQVDKLKSELYLSSVVYDTRPTIQYKKKLEAGGFLSVTYTIFTLNSNRSVRTGF